MDVIKITPEEFRDMAQGFKRAADLHHRCFMAAVDSDDREASKEAARKAESHRLKLVKLADKLEADKREALEFIPAKGVQA